MKENRKFLRRENVFLKALVAGASKFRTFFFQKTLEVTLPVVVDKTSDSLYIPPMLLPEIKKDIPKGQN